MDLIEDFIFENQRRLCVLPGNLAPAAITDILHLNLDSQYGKQNLTQVDPANWVFQGGKSTTPASVPLKDVLFNIHDSKIARFLMVC